MEQVHVLVKVWGGNIQDVELYVGPKAAEKAEASFEAHTKIPYSEYKKLSDEGMDNNEILHEDEEGTAIYLVDPIVCE